MRTRELTEAEFKDTFTAKMVNVTETATDVLNIWPYVEAVPIRVLDGHFVEAVYRGEDNRFDHVLVMTESKNVYLVVVVDLVQDAIYGHRLLDVNQEYGLT